MNQLIVAMMGQPGAEQPGGGGSAFLLFIFLMFVIVYFLLLRPQQKEHQRKLQMMRNLKKGDDVITSGGLLGRISSISGDVVTVDLGNKVKVNLMRSDIRGLRPKEEQNKEEKPQIESGSKK